MELYMSVASNVGRKQVINTTIVGQTLKYAGLGKRNYNSDYQGQANGSLLPSMKGETASNFNCGKVIKRKN